MQRLAEVGLESDKVDIPLLKQFSAVIVEDSTSVTLPTELAEVWEGCGGGEGTSEAGVKVFVQWEVLKGKVLGPRLSDARMNDHKTPFDIEELPEGSVCTADLFFAIERFFRIAKEKKERDTLYQDCKQKPTCIIVVDTAFIPEAFLALSIPMSCSYEPFPY